MTAAPIRTKTEQLAADVAERVARGVTWLDAVHPGWRDRIDVSRFDINDGCFCILGQLNREAAERENGFVTGFEYATRGDDSDHTWARSHGFLWRTDAELSDMASEVRALQAAWLDEIRRESA